jgi:acetyl-CoA C-acetyltransferase
MWPAAFGQVALEYERRYGLDRKYLNRIAELNYANARHNPLAQTRQWQFNETSFTDDDTANPIIEPGTRRQDCGQITDGACAVVLASESFARRHADDLSRLPRISGWGHRNAALRLWDKLERSRDAAYVFPHVREAIEQAWGLAGISGVHDLSGIETHDCFTTTEYVAIDHFGFTSPGQGWQAVADGRIEHGGACPINMSGGLIGCGHPVGATGVRMLLDCARQVTGQASGLQIEGAKRMQTLNIGGSMATVVSFVVERG